jgi:geranylgeranyl pyrophosphate synthase
MNKNSDLFKEEIIGISEVIGAIGEMIHNGSLVIDDIED